MSNEQVTRLRVMSEARQAGGRLFEVDLFCLEGRLSIGDRLTSAEPPEGGWEHIDAEVLEILFFQQMIDALDPVFSGRVLLAGEVGRLTDGWTVRAGPALVSD